MSHDLKTPLSVIKTSLYLLEHLQDPERQKEKIEVIKEQTLLLEKLIQDVLTMSRLDHGAEPTFGPVDLIAVIYDAKAKILPAAERKHQTIHLELDTDITCVLGSEDELWRMMMNLMENAVNYTPENGQITVRAFLQDGTAHIEIADTGIGISEKDLPRIFERFYRADPARQVEYGGTGLGLAIVNKIVEMHGGKISVESELEKGTTFQVTLMLCPSS